MYAWYRTEIVIKDRLFVSCCIPMNAYQIAMSDAPRAKQQQQHAHVHMAQPSQQQQSMPYQDLSRSTSCMPAAAPETKRPVYLLKGWNPTLLESIMIILHEVLLYMVFRIWISVLKYYQQIRREA